LGQRGVRAARRNFGLKAKENRNIMELLPEIKEHRVPQFPVDNLFLNRWSPRAFSSQKVPDDILNQIFEAARWAASSYNEQPWRFLIAKTPEDLAEFNSFLVPTNQAWAKDAPVLVVTLGKKTFTRNGKDNSVYKHDVGAASAYMALAATQHGLNAHGMAGFDGELVRATLGVPTDYDVIAMWALGYRGEPRNCPKAIKKSNFPAPVDLWMKSSWKAVFAKFLRMRRSSSEREKAPIISSPFLLPLIHPSLVKFVENFLNDDIVIILSVEIH
jgi:nitroreductase